MQMNFINAIEYDHLNCVVAVSVSVAFVVAVAFEVAAAIFDVRLSTSKIM